MRFLGYDGSNVRAMIAVFVRNKIRTRGESVIGAFGLVLDLRYVALF